MKKQRSLILVTIILMVAVLASACGSAPSPAPVPTSTKPPTETPLPPTPTLTPEPTATATITPTPAPVGACKLQSQLFAEYKQDKGTPTLPSLGTVKTAVLFVDFSDAQASITPDELFAKYFPDAQKYFAEVSYGKMDWQVEPHFVWLRLSKLSTFYGNAMHSSSGHKEFIQDAINLVDKDIDFSSVDSVIVMVPPEAKGVVYGSAWLGGYGDAYKADGKSFSTGATTGVDLPAFGFHWFDQAIGRAMGLKFLWTLQNNSFESAHRFAGDFSLMGNMTGSAPGFFAYERWELGWLDDSQIICQEQGEATVTISPVETDGGAKAVIVPIGEPRITLGHGTTAVMGRYQGIVVELRRATGVDAKLAKPGVLVYLVDNSLSEGQGPFSIFPEINGDPFHLQSPLAVGDSVTVENVTVTVISSTDAGDTVKITVNP